MIRLTLFIWGILGSINVVIAQTSPSMFRINGDINIDTGTITMELVTDRSNYPSVIKEKYSARIQNGKFSLDGQLLYPTAFRFAIENKFYSGTAVIDLGTQYVKIDIDSIRKIPWIDNSIMQNIKVYKASLSRIRDSLKNKTGVDSTRIYDYSLLQYVKQNPDSYAAFWDFVFLTNFGFEETHQSILSSFSAEIRKNYTSIKLLEKLSKINLAVGQEFPNIELFDQSNRASAITDIKGKRYILLDFWYSNCSPCIAQFPSLKSLYNTYKNLGFEIVGISTDTKSRRANWINTINKHSLEWVQLWDKDRKGSTSLLIRAFPSNFLLNSNFQIVKRNIKPEELKIFLEQNMTN